MPHFYRYRGDDDPNVVLSPRASSIIRESARETPGMEEVQGEAPVSLLGLSASLSVPGSGKEAHRQNLTAMFLKLDSSLKELQEENRQLREEVKRQKEKVDRHEEEIGRLQLRQGMPQLVSVGTGEDTGELEAKLGAQMEDLRIVIKKGEEEGRGSRETLSRDVTGLREICQELSARIAVQEDKPEYQPVEPVVLPEPVVVGEVVIQADSGEVDRLRQELEAGLAGVRDILTKPLSVAFDAVRCEDFLGQDGWLPFTKLNINLGEGMNPDTGMFTVPTSGLYLFLLNVYGAPRDGVVLSLRYNEISELASCSGVGKASQSVLADLDQGDTVAVWVNDKTKLSDTDRNRFTHFIGLLVRPDSLRFIK